MQNQVCIFSTTSEPEAIMVKGRLESEGVQATILNKKDSTYGTFGELEVYVQPGDEERARALIEESHE